MPTILKPGMKHQGEELYKAYINHGPGMTLTYLTASGETIHRGASKTEFSDIGSIDDSHSR